MYGSTGAFLSPENLVGLSGRKFPPDAATLSGLFFNANREQKFADRAELKNNLFVAGPFWAKQETPKQFYVPIPWSKILDKDDQDEWFLEKSQQANLQLLNPKMTNGVSVNIAGNATIKP